MNTQVCISVSTTVTCDSRILLDLSDEIPREEDYMHFNPISAFTEALVENQDDRAFALVDVYSRDYDILAAFYDLARWHGHVDLAGFVGMTLGREFNAEDACRVIGY